MSALKPPTPDTWKQVLRSAWELFRDLEEKGFGIPPFSLGGGTVLMFKYGHRLSKDIDFFGHDAQWLSLVSPRLNEKASSLATEYDEQANTVKIAMPHGDIDFIISADVIPDLKRQTLTLLDRSIPVDPPSEILAKKIMYRAATFKARDIYDLSAAIDLAPPTAWKAVSAASRKKDLLLSRLHDLKSVSDRELSRDIVPYNGPLRHAAGMVTKVIDFVGGKEPPAQAKPLGQQNSEGREL